MATARPQPDTKRTGKAIGVRLASFREAIGFNQTQFAAKVGVSQGTVSGWESGERPLGLPGAQRVCDAFAATYPVTLDWLFRGNLGGIDVSLRKRLLEPNPPD